MDVCFVDVIVEFLAVAFHNILYYASIYPKSIFEMRKKYGAVVYNCVHPEVTGYLNSCLRSIEEILKTGGLRRVEFARTDEHFKPRFKFVFDFERLAVVDETVDAYLVKCEQDLRAFCLLLATVSHKFNDPADDGSFEIYLHTNESIEVTLAGKSHLEDFPLIEAEDQKVEMDSLIPLRRLSIRNYNINTYIELQNPSDCNIK